MHGDEADPQAAADAGPVEPFSGPRRRYFFILTTGVARLAMNHALTLVMNKVFLEASVVGGMCLSLGLFGMICPAAIGPAGDLNLSLRENVKRIPWFVNITRGVAALLGLALGLWLFFGFCGAR